MCIYPISLTYFNGVPRSYNIAHSFIVIDRTGATQVENLTELLLGKEEKAS
jgi:hypothetical protein